MPSMVMLMLIPMLFLVQAFQSFSSLTPRMKRSVPMLLKPAMTMTFGAHSMHNATCFMAEEIRDVELVIKRTTELKPRERTTFQRGFLTLEVRMITAVSSSHQSLCAKPLVIHSPLSTIGSDVKLLFPHFRDSRKVIR